MTRPRRLTRRQLLAGGATVAGALAFGPRWRATAASRSIVDEANAFLGGDLEDAGLLTGEGGLALRPLAAGARYTSVAHRLSAASHLGVHWLGSAGPAVPRFEVRTAGRQWSAWEPLVVERVGAPAAPDDVFAALRYVAGESRVQYRVALPPGSWVGRVTLALIDARPGEKAPAVRAQAAAGFTPRSRLVVPGLAVDPALVSGPRLYDPVSGSALEVVPRAAWGADESLRKDDGGYERWHEMFVPPRLLVVHHTATRNNYGEDEAAAEVRSIYAYHALVQGWWDIGYNALIDRFGNVYEGRHGRGGDLEDGSLWPESLSAGVSGGHAKHHNYGSAGVALLGESTAPGWEMDGPWGARWEALVRYSSFEAGRCFLPLLRPGAANDGSLETAVVDFLRSDDEWHEAAPRLSGHRDFEQTYCPGDPVIALLPELRRQVHASLAATSRTGVAVTAPAREGPPGAPLSWSWAPEVPDEGWSLAGYEFCVEAWFKPEEGDDLDYVDGYTNERQPRPLWGDLPASATSLTYRPSRPGQYTLHVRPLVRGARGVRRAAFAGSHTYRVPRPLRPTAP
ncbi:MAG: N-acetylmuramoyl-L-alanine amidase [Dehalococcoidia bacterium]|nr:N-acetylmuramoyl-L-alanine amidase [Dehalococcoidia bacterium]